MQLLRLQLGHHLLGLADDGLVGVERCTVCARLTRHLRQHRQRLLDCLGVLLGSVGPTGLGKPQLLDRVLQQLDVEGLGLDRSGVGLLRVRRGLGLRSLGIDLGAQLAGLGGQLGSACGGLLQRGVQSLQLLQLRGLGSKLGQLVGQLLEPRCGSVTLLGQLFDIISKPVDAFRVDCRDRQLH